MVHLQVRNNIKHSGQEIHIFSLVIYQQIAEDVATA